MGVVSSPIVHLPTGADVECTFYNKLDDAPPSTPTDTPTDTPMPDDPCVGFALGDVNGPTAKPGDEREVNAIDAAFILHRRAANL